MKQNLQLIERMNYQLPLIAYKDRETLLVSGDVPTDEKRLCEERLRGLDQLVAKWLDGADIGESLTPYQAGLYNAQYRRAIIVDMMPLDFEVDPEAYLAKNPKAEGIRTQIFNEDIARLREDPKIRRFRTDIARLREDPKISGPVGKYYY